MFKLIQQKGSSSAGLLTATAIFIGLLVYANQFAFNNSENSFLSLLIDKTFNTHKSSDNVADPSVEVLSSVDTDTIQPSTQGIFETPTLAPEDKKVDVNSTRSAELEKLTPETSTDIELAANPALSQPGIMSVNYVSGHWYGKQSYDDQAALAAYHNAWFNTGQQYYSTTRANGRGNGRGKMNGDGEFNFSMKFKARGRMDADSDFDSNLVADGNVYQQNLYNVNAFYNPAYRYNYYSY